MKIDKQIKQWAQMVLKESEDLRESDIPKDKTAMDDDRFSQVAKDKIQDIENAIKEEGIEYSANVISEFLDGLYDIIEPQKRSDVSKILKRITQGDLSSGSSLVNAMNNAWNFYARNS